MKEASSSIESTLLDKNTSKVVSSMPTSQPDIWMIWARYVSYFSRCISHQPVSE